ncbi:MAG: hypothetical protein H7245_04955 [Candidatus Saccharibacteria bacterium]|nr:hypothetical protein [Pseudorhodobacter sp.]
MNRMAVALCLALVPAAAGAADPDWPCIQAKVVTLSAGLMWPAPVTVAPLSSAAQDLVEVLALRRVDLQAAEDHVHKFVASEQNVDAQVLGNVFIGVFERLAGDRNRLMAGIARYAKSQTALAARIDGEHSEMDQLLAVEAPHFDRVDKLEEQIDWDERIYHDRARSLTYVCETPVLLEKRAYAIAQMLLKSLPK